MKSVCYPKGCRSDGKRMLKTFESGEIFRLASWTASDPDDPDESDETFGMAIDADRFTSAVLVLDMLEGRILELEGAIYAVPCPDAALRVSEYKSGEGRKGIKIVERNAPREKPPRLIDIPVGGIFATGNKFVCHDGERIPALCMRTENQRYKGDDLMVTCVDLLAGTTFEKDAFKDTVIRYGIAALCPYGYAEGKMDTGGAEGEKPAG